MNHIQISRQLKAKYKWQPNMNLRPSQVQGWVSSEVLRKKKKAMLASLEWGEADVLEDLLSELISCLELGEDMPQSTRARREKAAKIEAKATKKAQALIGKENRAAAAEAKKAQALKQRRHRH